ncbi:hypothetical protein HK105_206271 [Polyrhizophydium stewartii]|uniref:UspA domain-containing protein n=1 Tax=Polyrhizophydium stewartii TaxID=2732419 RepID=A0ABR4N3X2_9FUNG
MISPKAPISLDTTRPTLPGASAASVHEDVAAHALADSPAQHSRTVAIAVDGSAHSDFSIDWAARNLLQPSDRVVLLNVRPFADMSMFGGAPFLEYGQAAADQDAFFKAESHKLLKQKAADLHARGFHVSAIALRGDAREELVFKVAELAADVFVIGSHGRGVFGRAMLGSVSDFVVHHVACAVVVTRMPAVKA